GVLGGVGLTLGDFLMLRGSGFCTRAQADDAPPQAPAADSVIQIFLAGGMSHIDSFDPKPDAAVEIRGELGAVKTNTGEYFGGQVAKLGNRLVNSTNWRAFAVGPNGYLSMGWKPDDAEHLDGSGEFLKWHWSNSSDEERLIYFLASGSPTPVYAIDPEMYFRLRRTMKHHDGGQPFAVAWSGPLFNYFFSHCWIDFRALGPDHPSRFGVNAPSIDWFENSRRAVLTHRQRCIEAAGRFGTLSANRWGLSACVGRDGYIVPGTRPNLSDQDEWGEGTVAPYAAASSIMFTPKESLAAIRAFMDLKDAAGKPLIWRDPEEGGFGFADAFNLDQGYVSDDYVGIDQGPMLLAIENARTGLIWKLFMEHHVAQRAVKRLKLKR
ncbi:MAG: DUF1501 domain-containing protein, partial [Planctomycetes bacterium]|nr:DUF1501 domain-containing protein [Planctomycetota bacterium]